MIDFSFFKKKKAILLLCIMLLCFPVSGYSMHIAEGFLPLQWCVGWYLVVIPFLVLGIYLIKRKLQNNPRVFVLLGIAGGLCFLLSALKLPSVTGSCSHLTGVALGGILFGPFAMCVIGFIVLLFQALLLAHGGITTLGANAFSMAVVGTLVAFGVYKALQFIKLPRWAAVFTAAFLSNIATYTITSVQLAVAFPSTNGSVLASFIKFATLFAYTQLPLAVIEGIVTVLIFNYLYKNNLDELGYLQVIKPV